MSHLYCFKKFAKIFFLLLLSSVISLGHADGLEENTDRMGMDFRRIELAAADPLLCQTACVGDAGCKSFTYVKPGFQGPRPVCYLKNGAPNPTPNNCCTSGLSPNIVNNIDDYFLTLPSWSSTHPLSSDVFQPTGAGAKDDSTVLPDPKLDPANSSGQSRYSCTTTPYTLTKTPDKIVTFNPDMGKLWLGGLLQGNGYSGGLGSLAELPIRQRAPLKIYIDLLGQGVVETVDAPDAASVQQGIASLVQRASSSGVPVGTLIDYVKHESSTNDETALNFGLSVKYMAVDVKSKFS
ncbi:MAG: PAN domain-containing protein [Methylococcaceae bacterium]